MPRSRGAETPQAPEPLGGTRQAPPAPLRALEPDPSGRGPGWEREQQGERGEKHRQEMTVAEGALTHFGGEGQFWAPSGPLPHPGGDTKTSVNLADPGPGFRHSRGKGHGGSGQEVTVAAGRVALLCQQAQKAAGRRRCLSPTRPRWARTSRGRAGPCAAGR